MSILQPEPCVPAGGLVPGFDQFVMFALNGVGTTDATGTPPADVPLTPDAPEANDYFGNVANAIEVLQDGFYALMAAAGAEVNADVAMASELDGSNIVAVGVVALPGRSGLYPFNVNLDENGLSSLDQTYAIEPLIQQAGQGSSDSFIAHAGDTLEFVIISNIGGYTFIGDAVDGSPVEDAEINAYANVWLRYIGPLPGA